jgi:2-isopropylmalate synthase
MPVPAKITLFDTTLRDGAQTSGIDFTLTDKHTVMRMLDDLGMDYIEGGYPGANPLDTELFQNPPKTRAFLTAFGMTKRAGRSAANDPGLATLLSAKAKAICFVAKSWDYHVRVALGVTLEENLESIEQSVKAALEKGFEPLVDCEHFFDGYKANPEYALACARTAYEAGARWVILCDTNGGTMPQEISAIVSALCRAIPGEHLGIHTHNDTGQADAGALAAIEAGARHVQGTLNGLGERCGNANLINIIATLKLKPFYASRFSISTTDEALSRLTHHSRALDELLNRAPHRHTPYVGENAFAHKGGIHASAILKDPDTYEHIKPQSVGNHRKVLVSDQAGRSNILSELERMGIAVAKDDPRIALILDEVKEREALGYAYEGADASFALLAKRILGEVPEFFHVERFKVNVERRYNADGRQITASEAIVKVRIGEETFITAAEGNGPVNALDQALRKDLGPYQKEIEDLRLVDYRVRILNGGTEAVTRVLLESADGQGEHWTTVGVSANIIDASFQALTDSIIYKLMKIN